MGVANAKAVQGGSQTRTQTGTGERLGNSASTWQQTLRKAHQGLPTLGKAVGNSQLGLLPPATAARNLSGEHAEHAVRGCWPLPTRLWGPPHKAAAVCSRSSGLGLHHLLVGCAQKGSLSHGPTWTLIRRRNLLPIQKPAQGPKTVRPL